MSSNISVNKQITSFMILVFVISWAAVIGITGFGGIIVKTVPVALLGVAMLLGTSVSGLGLLGIFDGVSGYKRVLEEMKNYKVAPKWWAIALLTVPGAIALSVLLLSPFLDNPTPAIIYSNNKLVLILSSLGAALFVALFEEIGWTGFLTPKFKRNMTGITTGLAIGFAWGLWHMILFIEADSFTSVIGIVLLFVRLFTTLPVVRIIMVILYENTLSFTVTMMMHVSFVFSMLLLEPTMTNNEMIIYILIRTLILLIAATVIIRKSKV